MKINLRSLEKKEVVARFGVLVRTERKITAEVIQYIRELDRRRIYEDEGYTSLFTYLTEKHGYSGPAAQRRIAAARLVQDVPSLTEDLESGALNLSQVALAAKCLKQKLKE